MAESYTHRCSRCARGFKRLEHLKRHQRVHEVIAPYPYSFCPKSFARQDICKRHELMHKDYEQGEHLAIAAKTRACTQCARTRERCDRARPCVRCFRKSLNCVYPGEAAANVPRTITVEPNGQQRSSRACLDSGGLRSLAGKASPEVLQHDPPAGRFIEAFSPGPQNTQDIPSGLRFTDTASGAYTNSIQQENSEDTIIFSHLHQQQDGVNPSLLPPSRTDSRGEDNLHINWLPADLNIDLDYSSWLELDTEMCGKSIGRPASCNTSYRELDLYACNDSNSHFSPSRENVEKTADEFRDQAAFQSLLPGVAESYSNIECSAISESPTCGQDIGGPARTTTTVSPALASPELQTSLGTEAILEATGRLYATSTNGARAPCTAGIPKRQGLTYNCSRLSPVSNISLAPHEETQNNNSFPDLTHITFTLPNNTPLSRAIRPTLYAIIVGKFRRFCLNDEGMLPNFASNTFPRVEHFNLFILLFFEHFDPILPIYHSAVADLNDNWILALAIVAVGSHYTDTEQLSRCSAPLHELLRRALNSVLESTDFADLDLSITQALTLSQIGMIYHGSHRLLSLAKSRRSILADVAITHNLLGPEQYVHTCATTHLHGPTPSLDVRWRQWVAHEGAHRLGHAIWLADSMGAYHFELPTLLSLDSAQSELPYDNLWVAEDAQTWYSMYKVTKRNPSLPSAVHTLFVERQAKNGLGEYGTLLVLHGIYHEMRKVKGFLNRKLATWLPIARGSDLNNERDISQRTFEHQNSLSSWKSAALDCIDVLHWLANAVAAQCSGREHGTILHLHFSRVILLAPHSELRLLASCLASLSIDRESLDPGRAEKASQAQNDVLAWAQRDEHKARLAAIHCGSIFWHVRRFGRQAFYEPSYVFMATLVLWAHCLYASRAPLPPHLEIEDNGADGVPNPTFMHLDRPVDDEIVQLFVRLGRPLVMRPFIAGVGDIYAPEGPIGVLREGRKLLVLASKAWGRTNEYVRLLEAMETYTTRCQLP